MTRGTNWTPYAKWMIWGPVVTGFLLPFLINSLHEPAFLIDLAKESDELLIMSFGAFLCDIPFFLVARFTMGDRDRRLPLKKGLRNLAIRFVPVLVLYAFVLYDVARSSALRLPGASTAPIAILFIQPVEILLVFLTNCILRRVTDNEDALANA